MKTNPSQRRDESGGIAPQVRKPTAARHYSILAEASRLLTSSLDYQATLNAIAQAVVPELADWCVVDLAGDDAKVERFTVVHSDPARVAWAKELHDRYPPRQDSGVETVLRTGQPIFQPEITDEMLVHAARSDDELTVLRALGFKSVMIAPLTAHGRTLGAITFVTTQESGHTYTKRDLKLAEELAQRAAIAVDNARLYREAQDAIRRHQDAEARLAALIEASEALLGSMTLDELLPQILTTAKRLFVADGYALWRADMKTGLWGIACHTGLSQTFTTEVLPWKIKISPLLKAPLVVEDVEADDTLAVRYQAHTKEGIRSLLVMPLRVRRRTSGTLAFYYRQPRAFNQTDIRVAGAIANLAAAAISSTELYEEQERLKSEAQAAVRRQRTFLRDVLGSVTEGKLFLCSTPRELPKRLKPFGEPVKLAPDGSLRTARATAMSAANRLHFPDDRRQDLITAVGEAAMNAVSHAGGGMARIYTDGKNTVQVWIEDRGRGIDVAHLPKATLQKGYTTAGTLGHGMKIMLSTVDRLWLLTGITGTKIVMEQDRMAILTPGK